MHWCRAILPAVAIAHLTACTAPALRGNGSHATACGLDVRGATYVGSNIYPKYTPKVAKPDACCTLCRATAGCAYWTYSPSCWGNTTDCCWLKTKEAPMGRHCCHAGSISGAAAAVFPPLPPHPPPPLPPPSAPVVWKCVRRACVRHGPAGGGDAYNNSACSGACTGPGAPPPLTSLASLRMRMLRVGGVVPSGWLQRQLATQVNGLSGHLERFWPDVMSSSWLHPKNHWHETYSDRGGNLPYWLNGVIPMVHQIRGLADRVDSTKYNLTNVTVDYMRRLVASQAAQNYPMHRQFNLGTWNVVRSCLLTASAVPSERGALLPFVINYIAAAHERLKGEGWGQNTLCTECDERHPSCSTIAGGGVCRFRYPDWMHILQELLDAHAHSLSDVQRALVFEHMELIGEWGFVSMITSPQRPVS
jgi:hypothetical protein